MQPGKTFNQATHCVIAQWTASWAQGRAVSTANALLTSQNRLEGGFVYHIFRQILRIWLCCLQEAELLAAAEAARMQQLAAAQQSAAAALAAAKAEASAALAAKEAELQAATSDARSALQASHDQQIQQLQQQLIAATEQAAADVAAALESTTSLQQRLQQEQQEHQQTKTQGDLLQQQLVVLQANLGANEAACVSYICIQAGSEQRVYTTGACWAASAQPLYGTQQGVAARCSVEASQHCICCATTSMIVVLSLGCTATGQAAATAAQLTSQ